MAADGGVGFGGEAIVLEEGVRGAVETHVPSCTQLLLMCVSLKLTDND